MDDTYPVSKRLIARILKDHGDLYANESDVYSALQNTMQLIDIRSRETKFQKFEWSVIERFAVLGLSKDVSITNGQRKRILSNVRVADNIEDVLHPLTAALTATTQAAFNANVPKTRQILESWDEAKLRNVLIRGQIVKRVSSPVQELSNRLWTLLDPIMRETGVTKRLLKNRLAHIFRASKRTNKSPPSTQKRVKLNSGDNLIKTEVTGSSPRRTDQAAKAPQPTPRDTLEPMSN